MAIAITLEQYLSERQVDFDVVQHHPTWSASQTAQAAHVSGKRLAKAVVLKDDNGYLLAVLPASCHIQFNRLKELLHRELALANEEEAGRFFEDCAPGAFPPLGEAYGLDTVIDDRLADQPEIYLEGGDHSRLLHLSGEQFAKLTGSALHGPFSRPG